MTDNFEEALFSKDLIEFPKELNKKCTKEEFHKMMTTFHDSDIPIEKVDFSRAVQSFNREIDGLLS